MQISRTPLSPSIALLAVVARHARNQSQEVREPQFPVEFPLRQPTPPSVAPSLEIETPDTPHDPPVEPMEESAHMGSPIIHPPSAHHGVELVHHPCKAPGIAPSSDRAHPVLEAADRTIAGNRVQARSASLVPKPLASPDLVAKELEALRDVHDACLLRMQPKPKPSLQHRAGARQRPLISTSNA